VGLPAQYDRYDPDKTQNYELGFKAEFLDRRLSVDASAYYIDWRHIQILLYDPTTFAAYNANAAGAKSQGLELTLETRPLTGLKLGAWMVWNQAILTEALPAGIPGTSAVASAGDRLPYDAKVSGNLSVEQAFQVTRSVTGFAGGAVNYVGNRLGEFTPTGDRQPLPGYAKIDLRAGLKYGLWSLDLFANNVADKRGLFSGGSGTFPPYAFNYIQPRTVGLAIARTY
jgi:outer membrane receptor protein involved in Fe transport